MLRCIGLKAPKPIHSRIQEDSESEHLQAEKTSWQGRGLFQKQKEAATGRPSPESRFRDIQPGQTCVARPKPY